LSRPECVQVKIPNGSFTTISEFVRDNIRPQLYEAKYDAFADRYEELIVGTGPARSTKSSIVTIGSVDVQTIKAFIEEFLDEDKQMRQLHLTLLTEESIEESTTYDSQVSSPPRPHKQRRLASSGGVGETTLSSMKSKGKRNEKTEIKKVMLHIMSTYRLNDSNYLTHTVLSS
jgi:hypothetical protein